MTHLISIYQLVFIHSIHTSNIGFISNTNTTNRIIASCRNFTSTSCSVAACCTWKKILKICGYCREKCSICKCTSVILLNWNDFKILTLKVERFALFVIFKEVITKFPGNLTFSILAKLSSRKTFFPQTLLFAKPSSRETFFPQNLL